jgi:hypothetical protein
VARGRRQWEVLLGILSDLQWHTSHELLVLLIEETGSGGVIHSRISEIRGRVRLHGWDVVRERVPGEPEGARAHQYLLVQTRADATPLRDLFPSSGRSSEAAHPSPLPPMVERHPETTGGDAGSIPAARSSVGDRAASPTSLVNPHTVDGPDAGIAAREDRPTAAGSVVADETAASAAAVGQGGADAGSAFVPPAAVRAASAGRPGVGDVSGVVLLLERHGWVEVDEAGLESQTNLLDEAAA